jgi:hypothetical protein
MKGSRRRGHNEGSVFQRADGRWVASISLEDGKRRDVYGRTRKEAAEKLLRLQRDLRAGLPLAREDQTVEQYLTSWINDMRRIYASAVLPATMLQCVSTLYRRLGKPSLLD